MENAEKMSITLTPQMAKSIRNSVAAGRFASASEVIRDAMRVWQQREDELAERLEAIKGRIKASMEDTRPSLDDAESTKRLNARIERQKQMRLDSAA